MEYKSQNDRPYNTIFDNQIDACSFLNGTDSNSLSEYLMRILKYYIDEKHFHACPYEKEEVLINPRKLFKQTAYHQGFLQITLQFYNKKDANIATISVEITFKKVFS